MTIIKRKNTKEIDNVCLSEFDACIVFVEVLHCIEQLLLYVVPCKSFVEGSQANIKLSSQDKILPGVSGRLVTITRTLEQ